MRLPANAPVPFSMRVKKHFPVLNRLRKPTPGTMAVIATVTLVGLCVFSVAIYPMMNAEYYQESQRQLEGFLQKREKFSQGLRPWSDPFDRK